MDLDDGEYNCTFNKKYDDKTLDQVRKLWATICDISKSLYGDNSQKERIYFQVLHMAGIRTTQIVIPEDAIEQLKNNVRCLEVISRDVVNHKAMAVVDVCLVGLSEMDKLETSKVIDSCIRYASECGIQTALER